MIYRYKIQYQFGSGNSSIMQIPSVPEPEPELDIKEDPCTKIDALIDEFMEGNIMTNEIYYKIMYKNIENKNYRIIRSIVNNCIKKKYPDFDIPTAP